MTNFSTTTTHKRIYALAFKPALLVFILCLGAALSCFAENKYWSEYGSQPVYVKQLEGATLRTLKFVHYKGNRLFVETNVDGGVAEISLLVSESMINNLRLFILELDKANELIFENKHYGAVTLLRPKVYPLIRFHRLPEAFSDLHTPIRTFIKSLIKIGNLSEANDLLSRIALDKVDIKYSNLTIELLNSYLAKQDYDAMASAVNRLPVEGIYSENIEYIIRISDILRGADKHLAVIPLYRKAEKHVTGELQVQIRMWLAYSLILADELDEALAIIDKIEEPEPNDPLFSLYKLLQGSDKYHRGNYDEALYFLTSGFVRTETSYTWAPEMLYLIGDCYAHLDRTIAARNVWKEITILYKDSIWAGNATESLNQLPSEEAETISETTETSQI